LLETYLVHPLKLTNTEIQDLLKPEEDFEQLEKYLIHPDTFRKKGLENSRGTIVKLSLLPPLSIDSKRILLGVKSIK